MQIYSYYVRIKLIITAQGYQGMVNGGENIVEASWDDVSGILQMVSYYLAQHIHYVLTAANFIVIMTVLVS